VPVKFHCGKCGKLIKAPDEAGGRRGKCPYCQQSVYIPSPPEEIDDIPLSPIDEGDVQRRDKLTNEADELLADIGRDDEGVPDEAPAVGGGAATTGGADLSHLILQAVQALQASELDRLDQVIAQLKRQGGQANARVQAMILDELPPAEFENCPTALYKGFLRTILEKL